MVVIYGDGALFLAELVCEGREVGRYRWYRSCVVLNSRISSQNN